MRKHLILLSLLLSFAFAKAQNLSNLSLTSGGDVDTEMNYILGEVLVFQFTGGDIIINGGSLGGGELPDGIMEMVKEKTDCGLISCYPNPAHHQVIIDFEGVDNISSLVILNELGQVVLQFKPISTTLTFNVLELPVGAYYVALLDGNRVVCVNKFVKQ